MALKRSSAETEQRLERSGAAGGDGPRLADAWARTSRPREGGPVHREMGQVIGILVKPVV